MALVAKEFPRKVSLSSSAEYHKKLICIKPAFKTLLSKLTDTVDVEHNHISQKVLGQSFFLHDIHQGSCNIFFGLNSNCWLQQFTDIQIVFLQELNFNFN